MIVRSGCCENLGYFQGWHPADNYRHVSALYDSQEGWQAALLLERCREQACFWRACRSEARSVSWRDQRLARTGLAQVDRGVGGRGRSAKDTGAVSGGSLRRGFAG